LAQVRGSSKQLQSLLAFLFRAVTNAMADVCQRPMARIPVARGVSVGALASRGRRIHGFGEHFDRVMPGTPRGWKGVQPVAPPKAPPPSQHRPRRPEGRRGCKFTRCEKADADVTVPPDMVFDTTFSKYKEAVTKSVKAFEEGLEDIVTGIETPLLANRPGPGKQPPAFKPTNVPDIRMRTASSPPAAPAGSALSAVRAREVAAVLRDSLPGNRHVEEWVRSVPQEKIDEDLQLRSKFKEEIMELDIDSFMPQVELLEPVPEPSPAAKAQPVSEPSPAAELQPVSEPSPAAYLQPVPEPTPLAKPQVPLNEAQEPPAAEQPTPTTESDAEAAIRQMAAQIFQRVVRLEQEEEARELARDFLSDLSSNLCVPEAPPALLPPPSPAVAETAHLLDGAVASGQLARQLLDAAIAGGKAEEIEEAASAVERAAAMLEMAASVAEVTAAVQEGKIEVISDGPELVFPTSPRASTAEYGGDSQVHAEFLVRLSGVLGEDGEAGVVADVECFLPF